MEEIQTRKMKKIVKKNTTISEVKKDWEEYEIFSMKYHQQTYGELTYHWRDIPEKVLFDAGFIHSFNGLRMKRKKIFEEEGRYVNHMREFGLDVISIQNSEDEENIIHHGIQCKLWNSTLRGEDLGTFYQSIFMRMKIKNHQSKGYLYHSGKLTADVRDDIDNTRGIIVRTLLPFTKDDSIEVKEEVVEEIKEKDFILRDYQKEAIDALNQEWDGVGLLNLPCGTGKTVIFSNHVREKNYKNIFIMSPLKVHVKQNLERVKDFIPEYDTLLLDSDSGGSTDYEVLEEKIEKGSCIISTTYKTAKELFKRLFLTDDFDDDFEDNGDEIESEDESIEDDKEESSTYESNIDLSNSILIIDEAHNLMNQDELIKIVKSFPKVLLVTATPPSCMEEILGCNTIYKYSFPKAIEDKHICDYMIYIPLLTKDVETGVSSVLIEKPFEWIDLDDDLSKKCLYLINGMLQTGSKRCIVYMRTKEECEEFNMVFEEINKRYHYLPCWIQKVTDEVSEKDRKKIIEEFEREEEVKDTLKILTSIYIFNEGVDIPKCDSVFITSVGENTSDIRMVQRMCRANRLVKENPNKIANCFLWTDDLNKIVDSLSLLKENDMEFHKKIRVINGDYDEGNEKERIELIKKENKEICDFIKVKCMCVNEIWEMKRQLLFEFCDKFDRTPYHKEEYKGIKISKWFYRQKYKIKSIDNDVYKKLSENIIVKNNMDKIKFTLEDKKELLINYIQKHNKTPIDKLILENGCKLGFFYYNLKQKIENNESEVYKEYEDIEIIKKDLDRYIKKKEEKKYIKQFTSEEKKNLLIKYVKEYNNLPLYSFILDNGFRLGSFYHNLKNKVDNNHSEVYKKYEDIEIIKKDFDKLIKERKEKNETLFTLEDKKYLLIKYVKKNNITPVDSFILNNGCRLGSFYSHLKQKVKNNESEVYKEYEDIHIIKKDFDRLIKEREEKVQFTIEEKIFLLKEYVKKNTKIPIQSLILDNGCKLGIFYSSLKQKIENNKSEVYKEYENIHIIKKDFDKFIKEKEEKKYIKQFILEEKKDLLIKYVKENNKVPTSKLILDNGCKLGFFYYNIKQKIINNESKNYKKYKDIEIIKEDFDRYIKENKKI